MTIPLKAFGQGPSSSPLLLFLESLSPSEIVLPEIKAYSTAVYFNYYDVGVSLLFVPIRGYKPKPASSRAEIQDKDLVLESIDVYNVATVPLSTKPTSTRKPANTQYSPFPGFPISIAREQSETDSTERLEVTPATTGRDFVAFLGEPSRKGGGDGPTGGSIGIWCEWKAAGVMVEFGGDEAKGAQAWERGKDATWSVLTFFPATT